MFPYHFLIVKNIGKSLIRTNSGQIGMLAKWNENVEEITYSDIFLTPVFMSMFNSFRNFKDKKIKYHSIASNGFDK